MSKSPSPPTQHVIIRSIHFSTSLAIFMSTAAALVFVNGQYFDNNGFQPLPNNKNRDGPNFQCTQEGYFSSPDDCTRFIRCVNLTDGSDSAVPVAYSRYDFDCAPGTVFDPSIPICNFPGEGGTPKGCEAKYPPESPDDGSYSSSTTTPTTSTNLASNVRSAYVNRKVGSLPGQYVSLTNDRREGRELDIF